MKACFLYLTVYMQEMRDARHWYLLFGPEPSLSLISQEYLNFGVLERPSARLPPPPETLNCVVGLSHRRLCLALFQAQNSTHAATVDPNAKLSFQGWRTVDFSELKKLVTTSEATEGMSVSSVAGSSRREALIFALAQKAASTAKRATTRTFSCF